MQQINLFQYAILPKLESWNSISGLHLESEVQEVTSFLDVYNERAVIHIPTKASGCEDLSVNCIQIKTDTVLNFSAVDSAEWVILSWVCRTKPTMRPA